MMESRCNTVYNGTIFNGFLECGSRFTLKLNTAKSTIVLKNVLDKSSVKLNFLPKKKKKKKVVNGYLYLPKKWSQGAPKTYIPILVPYI